DLFVAGGPPRLGSVTRAAARAGVVPQPVSPEVMGRLAGTVTPQGVVAVVGFVDLPVDRLDPVGVVPILHQVRDPGNAAAIVRSADAAGASGVVFTRASVDVYNDKAVRAAAGSLFHVPVVREAVLEEAVSSLCARGVRVLAADARAEASIHD